MDGKYVSLFRETGTLRLSTFTAFKTHSNNQQGDPTEGHAHHVINDRQNNRHFGMSTIAGENAYVLSFTSRTNLPAEFGSAFFEVIDPLSFCAEVARMIPGCIGAMIGPCIYVDDKLLVTEGVAPTYRDLQLDDGGIDAERLLERTKVYSGPRQWFLKNRNFEHQSEVRMIWQVSVPAPEPILICQPSLLKCISPALQ